MQLEDVLHDVTIGEALVWKNMQVFPLEHPNGHEPAYALIDDLLSRGEAEITELGDGASVATIAVRNHADMDALILDGTELHGAKQNRMVNITIIVGKHSEAPIPVSCVEQGRWARSSRGFASTNRTVASKLRNRKAHMVAEHLVREKRAATDQGAVWDNVDQYLKRAATDSATMAFSDAYSEREASSTDYVEHLKNLDACGAAVAINGELIGLDLVDDPRTFKKLWAMLLRGYAFDAALDAGAKAKPLSKDKVESWLRRTQKQAAIVQQDVAGVGEYGSVTGDGIAGGVASHAGRVVHLALFPATAP